jgi:TetR/AcrR family transcriptional regulator, fatty acid metabolism regulator protein
VTETITDRQFEIIEAAGKILTNAGVGGLTIKNLAKEMTFSEAAIYRHFSSKEKIVVAMLEYLANNMNERYTKLLDNQSKPELKFVLLFQSLFSFFSDNPHFVVTVFSDGLMEESGKINEAIINIMAVKKKHLKPIIEEGQRQHVFRNDIPSDDLIHIVMASMRLQMYKWRVANFAFDNIIDGDKLLASVLTLIKAK